MAQTWVQDGIDVGTGHWVDDAQVALKSLLAKYNMQQLGALGGKGILDASNGDLAGFQADPDAQKLLRDGSYRVASAQDWARLQNPNDPENGAGSGSMKEGILSALAAAAAMYGAGNFLGGPGVTDLGGGLTVDGFGNVVGGSGINTGGSILPDFSTPSWMQPTAGGVADTGFGAGKVAGMTPEEANILTNGAIAEGNYVPTAAEINNAFPTAAVAKTGTQTALQRILSGSATAADYGELGLRALPGLLGAAGASKQASSLGGLATQFQAAGAPSRARYEASFAPGFTMANDPGYQDALDASSKATLHSLSVSGNPAGSPNAWAASLADNNAKFAYPALQTYRSQALTASGIPNYNAAAPGAMTGQVGSNAGIYNGIGAAIGNVTNPQQSLADILKQYQESNGGSSIFKVAA